MQFLTGYVHIHMKDFKFFLSYMFLINILKYTLILCWHSSVTFPGHTVTVVHKQNKQITVRYKHIVLVGVIMLLLM